MPLLVLCCSVVLSLSGAREPFGSSIAKRREAEHRRSKTSGDVLGLRNPRLDIILGRILARRIERVENASYFFFCSHRNRDRDGHFRMGKSRATTFPFFLDFSHVRHASTRKTRFLLLFFSWLIIQPGTGLWLLRLRARIFLWSERT